jgi:tight adherence protein C
MPNLISIIAVVLVWSLILAVVIKLWWYPMWIDNLAERRFRNYNKEPEAPRVEGDEGYTRSRMWLFRAGFRSQWALPFFVAATVLGIVIGLVFRQYLRVNVVPRVVEMLHAFPGNIGNAFEPLAILSPWVVLIFCAILPLMIVRQARQRRLDRVAADLPVTMELLATLCESGLGFDAAVERIMGTLGRKRPLVAEFNSFRLEVLSGRQRIECFRRLAERVDYSPFTVFISAVVQAEQVGSSISSVMRSQAEDMHSRRREQAMEFVMSRPIKLLLPMVVGFLPGVFVWALGPVFFDLVSTLTGLLSPAGRLK